jgi:DNA-binding GntR family transcriptional regulator
MADARATRRSGGLRADAVAEAIRGDILSGALEPGRRLTFPELCAAHQVSVGVLREALVRLVYRGIVQTESNLGFKVLSLSTEGHSEHTMLRSILEPQFIRQAVLDGNVEWESDVLAAHHVLESTPVTGDGAAPPSMQWTAAHTRFHLALVSARKSARITEITARLHDEAAIYRRWASPNLPLESWQAAIAEEHRGLLNAVLARDADRAAELLEAHIKRAAATITVEEVPAAPSGNSLADLA